MGKNLQEFRNSVVELGYSYFYSKTLLTAIKLDLFNLLGEFTLSASELAEKTYCEARAMELMLNALVGMKILGKRDKLFYNTPFGKEILLKGKKLYIGNILNFHCNIWEGWNQLEESLHSGKPVKQHEMYLEDIDVLRSFIGAMHNTAMGHAELLAKVVPLKRAKTLLDIGAGSGAFSIYFCKANPNLRATLLDLPKTLEITKEYVDSHGMEDRITLHAGNYNESLPKAFDVAFLSHIIHSEGAEENLALMKRVYESLNPKGKIIIQDFFLQEDKTNPPFASVFALNMLLYTEKGRSYSFEETKGWLKAAGFKSIKWPKLRLPRAISIVIAQKH